MPDNPIVTVAVVEVFRHAPVTCPHCGNRYKRDDLNGKGCCPAVPATAHSAGTQPCHT